MKDKEHCFFRRAICHTPWSFLNQTRRVFFARLQCFRRVQMRASYAEACPNCYVALLDKLQKWICTTDGLSLAASLEPLAHCRNVVSLNLLYFFGSCSSELVQLVALPCFWGRLLVIWIDCMIFLSPFLDVARMSMSTVSFLPQLNPEIICLKNVFHWPMI